MPWYDLLLIILASAVIITFLAFGWRIAFGAYHPRRRSLMETRAIETENTPDLMAAYDAWEKTSYLVRSPFGYDLMTHFFPCSGPETGINHQFVIIAHGFTYTHHGAIKYASIMKDLGFNVVMFDERYHGESGGSNCTLGYYEQHDLRAVIDDTCKRFGPDLFLGTYGESMGAVTAILEQAGDDRLRFVIADCPFADLRGQLRHLVKRTHFIPVWPSLPIAEMIFRAKTKARIAAVSPIVAVTKAKQPILFIHGRADGFIPYESSVRLHAACPDPKALYLADNDARHAESFRKNREEYIAVVNRFMKDHVLKT
ncbi:MAG: alpha/beta hydrolase [bacterium]